MPRKHLSCNIPVGPSAQYYHVLDMPRTADRPSSNACAPTSSSHVPLLSTIPSAPHPQHISCPLPLCTYQVMPLDSTSHLRYQPHHFPLQICRMPRSVSTILRAYSKNDERSSIRSCGCHDEERSRWTAKMAS